MRILQTRLPPAWVNQGGENAAQRVHSYTWMAVYEPGLCRVLIDDAVMTRIKSMSALTIDPDDGIAFISKDADTMRRGFKELVKRRGNSNEAFTLKTTNGTGLSALFTEWNNGTIVNSTRFGAGVSAVSHNAGQFVKRLAISAFPFKEFLKRHGVTVDHYIDVEQAKQQASRDGKLGVQGCALWICNNSSFPIGQLRQCSTWRQIDDTVTLGMLETIVTRLSK